MKQTLASLVLAFMQFPTLTLGETGRPLDQFYPDGGINREAIFENGKPSGPITEYHYNSNGQIKPQETCKDSKKVSN